MTEVVTKEAGAGGFQLRLFAAMMFVVVAVTGAVLFFAQRNAAADAVQTFELQFQGQLSFLLGAQESRLAAIAERCRTLAKSVRIRAALEENVVEDLYLNGEIELRDMLKDEDGATSIRAEFFRFLNAGGKVLSPPRVEGPESWTSQLVLQGGASAHQQQVGYITVKSNAEREEVREVVATPIITTDTGEVIGSIVLGFKPPYPSGNQSGSKIKNGIWISGRLHMPSIPDDGLGDLSRKVAMEISASKPENSSVTVDADGEPHLLFYKLLNPGSRFAPAYQVCLYPLRESIAHQQELRWKIIGAGLLVLLCGLAASHFISMHLSKPVEKLAEDSAEHRTQRVRAETELELTHDELRERNTDLQKALADLKAAQQQVIQQERMRALGQMASGIAHDFNNALVPILGFCELLQYNPEIMDDRPQAMDYLDHIQVAAKDAANVVSRLREFYRSKDDDEKFTTVNLKKLVEQAVTLTQPKWKDQAQAAGATVRVMPDLSPVPPVAGDESALREVLTNLIFNAVDAMPGGGTITVRTRNTGDSAVIEIADTGTGMTGEVRQRCLEPFFSTKGERGTGLGLAMVFGIVQRHGGRLDIRSEIGKGTTFIIELPLQKAGIEVAKVVDAPAQAQRPLHVLVVDDDSQVRDLLSSALAQDGHEVTLANHGVEGLRKFLDGKFDLVMTDQAMPGMSGDQMATAIKQFAPLTPIVLLTGFGQFLGKEKFPSVDVLASKPIGIPALRATIVTAMQSA
jgi:signal transduction histidine kinase